MTALYWILGILAFFVLLALLPLHAVMVLSDEDGEPAFAFHARVLFVKIPLYPRKKKLPRLGKYTIRRLRKKGKALDRKEKAKKKPKKAVKKAAAQKTGGKKSAKKAEPAPKKAKRNLRHLLRLVLAVAKVFLGRFGRYLRIETAGLDISIASEDPAKTAVFYGAVYAAAEAFFDACGNLPPMRRIKKSDIALYADFGSEKPHVKGKITFTLKVWHLFALVFSSGWKAFTEWRRNRREESAEERAQREQAEAAARAAMVRELRS